MAWRTRLAQDRGDVYLVNTPAHYCNYPCSMAVEAPCRLALDVLLPCNRLKLTADMVVPERILENMFNVLSLLLPQASL
jgi:hypothetical protein